MISTSNTDPLKKKKKTVTDSILFSRWEKVTPAFLGENSQKSKSEVFTGLAVHEGSPHLGSRDGRLRGPMSRVQGLPRFISATAVWALLSTAIHQEIKRQFSFEVLGFFSSFKTTAGGRKSRQENFTNTHASSTPIVNGDGPDD